MTLRAIVRPSASLQRAMGILHPGAHPNGTPLALAQALDETIAVDALSRLLTEAIDKNTSKDGRIDMRDVAAHVLARMKRDSR